MSRYLFASMLFLTLTAFTLPAAEPPPANPKAAQTPADPPEKKLDPTHLKALTEARAMIEEWRPGLQ